MLMLDEAAMVIIHLIGCWAQHGLHSDRFVSTISNQKPFLYRRSCFIYSSTIIKLSAGSCVMVIHMPLHDYNMRMHAFGCVCVRVCRLQFYQICFSSLLSQHDLCIGLIYNCYEGLPRINGCLCLCSWSNASEQHFRPTFRVLASVREKMYCLVLRVSSSFHTNKKKTNYAFNSISDNTAFNVISLDCI